MPHLEKFKADNKPINIPIRGFEGRPISYLRDPALIRVRHPAGQRFVDRRKLGQKKVRFDYELEMNPFLGDEDHRIFSPDGFYVEVDSADDIKQDYHLHPHSGVGGCALLRPMVDPVHKIIVTYHFDQTNLRWVRVITRLREDLPIVRPPANQHTTSPQYVFRSRGTRYIRKKQKVETLARRRFIANRTFRGRSGVSGAHGILGEFRSGLR